MTEPATEPKPVERLPVSVLTGFLGSGKTTLLRELLRHPDFSETAVVINEFGEIGLDHLLVESAREDMVLLASGCLCCTISGDLVTSLRRLYQRRAAKEIPLFRRVVVETTGLADPAPILHTLMQDPMLAQVYRLDGVIATVDAVNGDLQAVGHGRVRDRLAFRRRARRVLRFRRVQFPCAQQRVGLGEGWRGRTDDENKDEGYAAAHDSR